MEEKPSRPTIGQIIDDLGSAIEPENRRVIENTTKALIIISAPGRLPGVAIHGVVCAGDLNLAESLGMLEIARQGLTSPGTQREGIARLLISDAP